MCILPTPDVPSSTSSSGSTLSSTFCLTSTNYDSDSESPACQALVRSDGQLRPWLPISYIETTLKHLNSRPQVQTFKTLLLPLPNDTEDDIDASQSDFRKQEEESQSSFPALQTIPQNGESLVTQAESPTDHL